MFWINVLGVLTVIAGAVFILRGKFNGCWGHDWRTHSGEEVKEFYTRFPLTDCVCAKCGKIPSWIQTVRRLHG